MTLSSSTLEIRSFAFEPMGAIPAVYTCDGPGVSPPLDWRGVPDGAQSLLLIVDDPDAPGGLFTHWIVFNVPPSRRGFSEGVVNDVRLPDGSLQGTNDFGKIGYGGPCPPHGSHRYQFHLYALDVQLNLPSGADRNAVDRAMDGHVLAQAGVMARYQRPTL